MNVLFMMFFPKPITVDNYGYFVCSLVTTIHTKLTLLEKNSYVHQPFILYSIPRDGDVLFSLHLHGKFKHAKFFTYSCVYDIIIIDELLYPTNTMKPFVTGIPLAQISSMLYLRVVFNDRDECRSFKVSANYTTLSLKHKNELVAYKNGIVGCKLHHRKGTNFDMVVLHPEKRGEIENHLDFLYI